MDTEGQSGQVTAALAVALIILVAGLVVGWLFIGGGADRISDASIANSQAAVVGSQASAQIANANTQAIIAQEAGRTERLQTMYMTQALTQAARGGPGVGILFAGVGIGIIIGWLGCLALRRME